MYLLDTNVVSELRRGARADAGLRAWNDGVAESACWLSSMTLFELRLGALQKQRRDPAQGEVLLRWIARVRDAFAGRIIELDVDGWMRCAELHVPRPRPLRDSVIATCALLHGLTVVTRNERDFVGTGAPVLNPWSS